MENPGPLDRERTARIRREKGKEEAGGRNRVSAAAPPWSAA